VPPAVLAVGLTFTFLVFGLLWMNRRYVEEEGRLLRKEQGARADAESALGIRNEFLSIASHELKTPVTALKLQLQLIERLAREGGSPTQINNLAHTTTKQVDRLTTFINELLDITRLESGGLALRRESTDLAVLVRETAERYRSLLEDAGCDIHLSADVSVIGLWDPYRIEQVLVNLLTNVEKYARGAPVEISVRDEGGYGVFTVRDHGPGVARAEKRKVFQRFERGTTEGAVAGLGLGLFIVKQIVAAHGGAVELESAQGRGALFTIRLPKQPPV
jgi:signal transduction histidine kinase